MADKLPPVFCAHCGARVTAAGRAPRTGRRYCSQRDCQTVKKRDDRDNGPQVQEVKDAPTACTSCSAPMPARKVRASDDVLGRWCRKAACRRHREDVRQAAQIGEVASLKKQIDRLTTAVDFLSEVVMADNEHYIHADRIRCQECGLTSAIEGWPHPLLNGQACFGTLAGQPARNYGRMGLAAWPMPKEYDRRED